MSYRWIRAHKHSFSHAFPAGNEADGRELFITQVLRIDVSVGGTITFDEQGSPVFGPTFDRWESAHLGKAGVHLARGCTYSFGGKEIDADDHFVFVPDDPAEFEWVDARDGEVPPGAVAGWNRDERQYVARMSWEGGWHPGKLIPGSRACFIGYGGGEKASHKYQVLCRK